MIGAISPLSMNPLTRDLWGQYDPLAIAQFADFLNDGCYQIKFYKAPSSQQELFAANGYAAYGLKITPGSIIFGFYLPAVPNPTTPGLSTPGQFTVQVRDVALKRDWFDAPMASVFLSNFKPTYQSGAFSGMGSFPNLLSSPYPVVGDGVFLVKIQESSGSAQRIEVVFGVLEVCQAL